MLETAVHRVDAERVLGPASPVDPALAADGVAEVVDVLHPRQLRLGRAAVPAAALRLTTDDGQGSWLVAGPSPVSEISGPAETLLLLVWGRTDLDDPRQQVEDRRRAGCARRATHPVRRHGPTSTTGAPRALSRPPTCSYDLPAESEVVLGARRVHGVPQPILYRHRAPLPLRIPIMAEAIPAPRLIRCLPGTLRSPPCWTR